MRIIVTGGCGFIGSHFIKQTINRPEVEKIINVDCLTYASDPMNPSLGEARDSSKYHFEQLDICDYVSMDGLLMRQKPTHIIHFAAETHVDRSITGPHRFIQTNVFGTFNLLEACRKHPVNKFLHVSTDEVYGSSEKHMFTEDSILNPSSPYSASKASADMLCLAYHKTYHVPCVITRCVNNYGPNQYPEKFIPVVIKKALAGEPVPLYGNGHHERDWIHVSDHCEALWLALTRGEYGFIYNIAAHASFLNLKLAVKLCDLCDADRSLITFVEDRPGHDLRYSISDKKIRLELGFGNRTYIEDGLRATVEWYRHRFASEQCTTEAQPLSR